MAEGNIPFKEARKFPPTSNRAYKEAVAAEMLAIIHGLAAEDLYLGAQAARVSLYDDYSTLARHKGACERVLPKKTKERT